MNILTSKEFLRKKALNTRNKLFSFGLIDTISNQVASKILMLDEFKNAKNIAMYYPIQNEINLLSLLKEDKNFYFPKCIGDDLFFAKYKRDCFELGNYNIPEPTGRTINPSILDLILIPSLMANKKCFRLGYGKGYYDRFFNNNKTKAKKIIIVPSVLISEDFIENNYDYKCDMVLSEKETYYKDIC